MRKLTLSALVVMLGCSSTPNINHGAGGSAGTGGGGGGGSGSGGSGGSGSGGSGGTSGGVGDGGDDNGCPPSAKLVYIIDSNGTFSSFAPNQTDVTKSIITDLGKLACPAAKGAQPFSMSVDRNGTAWVEYISTDAAGCSPVGGQIFNVPTTNISMCTATSYTYGQSGFNEFGMGFVADSAGASTDTLYIGGGAGASIDITLSCVWPTANNIGTYNTTTNMITKGAAITGEPELTGTGDGKLYAFFPDATNPRISEIDKSAGTESNTIALATLKGTPTAWAFAFWGGDFWVFLMKDKDKSSTVYHVTGANGTVTSWALPKRTIVGAGVSTCAPTSPIT